MSAGRLSVVATPIGNLADLSPRAREALAQSQLWIVEDTRVSGRLRQEVGSDAPMRVLNDHASPGMISGLADLCAEEEAVLVSDAGTPAISDPGAQLVDLCHERGIPVSPLPGPSAPIAALSASGFFAQRYAFLGYPPRKAGALRDLFAPFADSTMTLVMLESPHRFRKTLSAANDALGDRRAAICRELTKRHEQIVRLTLDAVPSEQAVPAKGEVTLVIEGRRKAREV